MSQAIRVGVIGAGTNTKLHHIPGLQAIEGVEIVTVCNRSRESSERVAKEFNIPSTHAHWTDVIEDETIDAIVIGTWPYLHAPITIEALEAGKHVLVEARMAMDAVEARQMYETSVAHPELVAQVVPSPFTLGVDATVKRLIAEGFIGEPLAIEIHHGNTLLDRDSPLHWRQDSDLSGHNVLTMGIWYESLMRWVGEATRVTAMGRVFQKMRRAADGSMRAVRVPEHVEIIADMACGALAHMRFSAVTGMASGPEAFVYGSDGTLRFDGADLFGGRRGDKELKKIEIPSNERASWRVEAEFIGAIRGEEPVRLTTFRDGVKYMEFTTAVAQSIESGGTIELPMV
ncbi:Gfo/Idh/MocA family oxidoreductase [bacterium]|nr:Gfo/Idh/MocA family oxidoreductase [bacterium]